MADGLFTTVADTTSQWGSSWGTFLVSLLVTEQRGSCVTAYDPPAFLSSSPFTVANGYALSHLLHNTHKHRMWFNQSRCCWQAIALFYLAIIRILWALMVSYVLTSIQDRPNNQEENFLERNTLGSVGCLSIRLWPFYHPTAVAFIWIYTRHVISSNTAAVCFVTNQRGLIWLNIASHGNLLTNTVSECRLLPPKQCSCTISNP